MLTPEQSAAVRPYGGEALTNGPHNPDDRGPLSEALWKGVLAVGEHDDFKNVVNRGSSRTTAHYGGGVDGGAGIEYASAVYTWYRPDGTRLHRKVVVTVVEDVDNNDGYWSQVEDEPHSVRHDGHHYIIGAHSQGVRGFGGARWHIAYSDGRPDVYTDDLWSQGPIPPAHRDRLPDNVTDLHQYDPGKCCALDVTW